MNIFREFRGGVAVGGMLRTVKESAETETRMTRGPPNDGVNVPGKMSRSNLIGKHFPFFNESRSEANQLATRWAHQDDVKAGDRNVFSYHGSWYLVEAFDNADMGYQIVEKLTKQQYNAYTKEVDDAEGQSVAERVSRIGESNRQRERLGAGKPSSDNAPAEHRGEDLSVQRVGAERNSRRQAAGDRDGNLPRRRSSIEEARLEFESSRIFQLSAQIQRLDAARKKAQKGSEKRKALNKEIRALREELDARMCGSTSGKASRELEISSDIESQNGGKTANEAILQQMEALKAEYRKVLEAEELDEAFLRGFNMEE